MTSRRQERRALLLAYYFPPIGGGGIQRPLTLVERLPCLEPRWQVRVLTGPGQSRDRWGPRDETLLGGLPHGTEIRRIEKEEPRPHGRFRSAADRWTRLPSPYSVWWKREASRTGLEAARGVDAMVAIMPPFDTAVAAARISRTLGIPWVADLGDPWALDEMYLYPTGAHRRLELRRMRRLLRTAAAIVMSTPEASRRLVSAFPELTDRPIVDIPNGFAAADFADPPAPRQDGRFRIVHTGSLHTDLGRRQLAIKPVRRLLGGGTERGVQLIARSHVYLLAAVEQLVARRPELAEVVRVCFAGVLSPLDQQEARRLPQSELLGHVDHRSAVEFMQTADLLFLPLHAMAPGVRATIVPGKTYEYLAAGRPILAAVPEGDARDILLASGVARVCNPTDTAGLSGAIEAEIGRWQAGTPQHAAAQSFLAPFERRTAAERYGKLLEEVTSERGAAELSVPRVADGTG